MNKINYNDKWYVKVLKGLYIAAEYIIKYLPRLISLITKSGRDTQATRKANIKEHRQVQKNIKLDIKRAKFENLPEVK